MVLAGNLVPVGTTLVTPGLEYVQSFLHYVLSTKLSFHIIFHLFSIT